MIFRIQSQYDIHFFKLFQKEFEAVDLYCMNKHVYNYLLSTVEIIYVIM